MGQLARESVPTQKIDHNFRPAGGAPTVYEIARFTTRENPHTKFVITKHKELQSKADGKKWWMEEGHEEDWKELDFYAQVLSEIAFKDDPVNAPLPPTVIWMDSEKDAEAFGELIDDFFYGIDPRNKTVIEQKLQNVLDFWQKHFVSKPLKIS